MKKLIAKHGLIVGALLSVISFGLYGYAIHTLISIATDVISPAYMRGDTALMTDVRVFDLMRKTKEQQQSLQSQYLSSDSVVSLFDSVEHIRKRTGASVLVNSISEQLPQKAQRVRSSDDEDASPASAAAPASQDPKGLGSVSLVLEIRGSKEQVHNTIRLLDSLPLVSYMNSFSLRSERPTDGSKEERLWVGNGTIFVATLPGIVGNKK
jgi:hypothetical protein